MNQATDNFFNCQLQDKEVVAILNQELDSYNQRLMLIASENFTSRAVLEAQGSVLTNKYAEGYPGKRYYGGCENADAAESLAVERLCKLFDVKFANVQSHSGSQANQAVLLALLSPGDTYLAMNLGAGGHLTHGSPVNLSGRWFNPVHYGVNEAGLIDYDLVRDLALKHKPKVIICGASSYSRLIDFQKFREIADEVSAYLWADIAHYSGLIAAKQWPNPAEHVHVMTTTTHKTLRGPRGGAIMTNDAELAVKLDRAVFPGLQGGPLVHVMAAKAVAFGLALQPSFTTYIKQVIANAKTLAAVLQDRGLQIVSGGTDCHMFLVNLVSLQLTGADTVALLDKANLIVNKNVIPFEKLSPRLASGIRIGTPTCTSRGMGKEEFTIIGELIAGLITGLAEGSSDLSNRVAEVKQQVQELAVRFPVYKFRH